MPAIKLPKVSLETRRQSSMLSMDLGVTLKLLGNSTILGAIELLSETFALSDKIGFDSKVLYEFIRE